MTYKTVYLAGPMSGRENWNFPAFFELDDALTALGYDVLNPARWDGSTVEGALEMAGDPSRPRNSWEFYMKRDLPQVMSADAICLLPGWKESRGARLEARVARELGIPHLVFDWSLGALVPRIQAVGIAGYARSGKDTAAEYFVEQGYRRISFADPIKEALRRVNPFIEVPGVYGLKGVFKPLDDVLRAGETWESIKGYGNVREMLQRFGTEVGREMFDANFWVNLAFDGAEDGSKLVIPDVRFVNEADAIRSIGGVVIRIERDGVGATNSHISETSMDDYSYDYVIENNLDIESLHANLKSLHLF